MTCFISKCHMADWRISVICMYVYVCVCVCIYIYIIYISFTAPVSTTEQNEIKGTSFTNNKIRPSRNQVTFLRSRSSANQGTNSLWLPIMQDEGIYIALQQKFPMVLYWLAYWTLQRMCASNQTVYCVLYGTVFSFKTVCNDDSEIICFLLQGEQWKVRMCHQWRGYVYSATLNGTFWIKKAQFLKKSTTTTQTQSLFYFLNTATGQFTIH